MPAVSVLHAPSDTALGKKIAAALARDGHDARSLSADAIQKDEAIEDDATIVIWSNAAAKLARLRAEARDAMARRGLIPVAVGRSLAPEGFEGLAPVNLAGWAGDARDPRWRFVLDEIELAARRRRPDDAQTDPAPEANEAGEPSAQADEDQPGVSLSSAPYQWSAQQSGVVASISAQLTATPDNRLRIDKIETRFRPVHVVLGGAVTLLCFAAAALIFAPGLFSGARFDDITIAGGAEAGRDENGEQRVATLIEPNAATSGGEGGDADFEMTITRGANTRDGAPSVATTALGGEGDRLQAGDLTPVLAPLRASQTQAQSEPEAGAPAPGGDQEASEQLGADQSGDELDTLMAQIALEAQGEEQVSELIEPAETGYENALHTEYFRDCAQCPDMAVVEPGRFLMGAPETEGARLASEGPVQLVTIEKSFALGAHEVTFEQWDACVADGGCRGYRPADQGWGRGARPVVNVSFEDAQSYVAWLSQKTGATYRLPSEAEWEYAARAGVRAPFADGFVISPARANFNGEYPYGGEAGVNRAKPTPAASFAPNAFGLFDMHGNVWEWTVDCWAPSHAGAASNGAPRAGGTGVDCSARVLKGGAFNTGGWRLRAGHRISKGRYAREFDNGLRVAREMN